MDDDAALLDRLVAGDEPTFVAVVRANRRAMIAVARAIVRDDAIAEECVQEAWLRALDALDSFEKRSSFRTWLVRIVANVAKTRAVREKRLVPLEVELEDGTPSLDPARFTWIGSWARPPSPWDAAAESALLAHEAHAIARAAVDALPPLQRAVVTLRDFDEWTSEEVCATLEITPGNERVLLHRARTKLRAALEAAFEAKGERGRR